MANKLNLELADEYASGAVQRQGSNHNPNHEKIPNTQFFRANQSLAHVPRVLAFGSFQNRAFAIAM